MLDFVSTRRDVLKTWWRALRHLHARGKGFPALAESSAGKKTVAPDEVDGFLSIDADGQVTVYSGKVDLGTGLRTALTQIAAEELDVPLERCNADPGRHRADAGPGSDLCQLVDLASWDANSTGRGDRAQRAHRGRHETPWRAHVGASHRERHDQWRRQERFLCRACRRRTFR